MVRQAFKAGRSNVVSTLDSGVRARGVCDLCKAYNVFRGLPKSQSFIWLYK